MSYKKVLITGAGGFIGKQMCVGFQNQGYQIVALSRKWNKDLNDLGINQVIGDLNDPLIYVKLPNNIDLCIHCAANASFNGAKSIISENLKTTQALVDYLKSIKSAVIFLSSIGAVDRKFSDNCIKPIIENDLVFPTSAYGKSKVLCENYIQVSGLKYTIIRPALVVGNRMRLDSHFAVFARLAIKLPLIAKFPWTGQFSVLSVEDLVSATIHIAKYGMKQKIYNCSGNKIALRQFFEMCGVKQFRGHRFIGNFSKYVSFLLPFKLKSILLPALVSSDADLRKLGWKPANNIINILQSVIDRERAKLDVCYNINNDSLVTGAASGLGYEIAKNLSEQGVKLVLVDKDIDSLHKKFSHMEGVKFIQADLTKKSDMAQVLYEIRENKKIVNLFLVAGFGVRGLFSHKPLSDQIKMLRVLFEARLVLTHEFMQRTPRLGFARIILVSSSSAFQSLPFMSVYAASNAAILSFGRSLTVENVNTCFRILTVCPGGMNSAFQKRAGVKKLENESLMEPSFVAKKILDDLNKNRHLSIISFRAHAMAFLARILPMLSNTRLWGKLMKKVR